MVLVLHRAIFHATATSLSGVSSIITELSVFRGEIEPDEIIAKDKNRRGVSENCRDTLRPALTERRPVLPPHL